LIEEGCLTRFYKIEGFVGLEKVKKFSKEIEGIKTQTIPEKSPKEISRNEFLIHFHTTRNF